MAIDNILRKYKETPEGLRGLLELGGLMLLIISIFIIFYIVFPSKEKIPEEDIVQESSQSEESYKEVINSLPSGQVNFYTSDEGYELTLTEYEAVCKNTKIVTQRSIMGAHITDIRAQKLYKDNGNNLESSSVVWDSSANVCIVEYVLEAVHGTTDTITVVGEAKGFLNTGIDTRVYFIKNF